MRRLTFLIVSGDWFDWEASFSSVERKFLHFLTLSKMLLAVAVLVLSAAGVPPETT